MTTPKIYFYKLIADNGGAPCVAFSLLSLAICKPMIRATAREGDVIISFAANSLHADNRLIYVARVSKRLGNGIYFKDPTFSGRPDCIYEWRGGSFAERLGARYHGGPDDLAHDIGNPPGYPRANTLLSQEFCFFGRSGSDAYKREFPIVAWAVATLGRGHRVNHSPNLYAELECLVRWACPLNRPVVKGTPYEALHRENCLCGGCGAVAPKKRC